MRSSSTSGARRPSVERHDGDPVLGPAGLEHDLGELERADRRLRRGPQHDRVAGRERRRDLVRDEVEREVERRDAGDRPERHAAHVRDAALGAGQPVERHDLAVDALRLLGGDAEGERGAIDLEPRGLDRLARLERDRAREVLLARASIPSAMPQSISARRQPGSLPRHLERAHGARDRRLDLGRARRGGRPRRARRRTGCAPRRCSRSRCVAAADDAGRARAVQLRPSCPKPSRHCRPRARCAAPRRSAARARRRPRRRGARDSSAPTTDAAASTGGSAPRSASSSAVRTLTAFASATAAIVDPGPTRVAADLDERVADRRAEVEHDVGVVEQARARGVLRGRGARVLDRGDGDHAAGRRRGSPSPSRSARPSCRPR